MTCRGIIVQKVDPAYKVYFRSPIEPIFILIFSGLPQGPEVLLPLQAEADELAAEGSQLELLRHSLRNTVRLIILRSNIV